MEYVTKMPSSLHLFGHMPQKRSRDGGAEMKKRGIEPEIGTFEFWTEHRLGATLTLAE
jgi:hypothetical protein